MKISRSKLLTGIATATLAVASLFNAQQREKTMTKSYEQCTKCGGMIWYSEIGYSCTAPTQMCTCNQNKEEHPVPSYLLGWQCPVCGLVMSPFVSVCPGVHLKVTTSGSSTEPIFNMAEGRE